MVGGEGKDGSACGGGMQHSISNVVVVTLLVYIFFSLSLISFMLAYSN